MIIQLQISDSNARLALYALRKRFGLPEKRVRAVESHLEPLIKLLLKTTIAEELKKDSDAAMTALDNDQGGEKE